uniref:Uncharacterized protein n=1 Tax=Sus scrofa TaxID=9823 RepID=A0A8D0MGR2_PIG
MKLKALGHPCLGDLCLLVVASLLSGSGVEVVAAASGVLQIMKHTEPQVKQVFHSLSKSAFNSGYYRGGVEPKMIK